jgi:hypothetical protein
MVEALFAVAYEFVNFLIRTLIEVPLAVTVGSATILTFIWLINEIFTKIALWRIVLVTIWSLVALQAWFAPVQNLGKEQLWFVVVMIGIGVAIVDRGIGHRIRIRFAGKKACPHCGGAN